MIHIVSFRRQRMWQGEQASTQLCRKQNDEKYADNQKRQHKALTCWALAAGRRSKSPSAPGIAGCPDGSLFNDLLDIFTKRSDP